jgi:hypothetical protein
LFVFELDLVAFWLWSLFVCLFLLRFCLYEVPFQPACRRITEPN